MAFLPSVSDLFVYPDIQTVTRVVTLSFVCLIYHVGVTLYHVINGPLLCPTITCIFIVSVIYNRVLLPPSNPEGVFTDTLPYPGGIYTCQVPLVPMFVQHLMADIDDDNFMVDVL